MTPARPTMGVPALALLALALSWPIMAWTSAVAVGSRRLVAAPDGALGDEAYPPLAPPDPVPSPTPVADAGGFLPPPAGLGPWRRGAASGPEAELAARLQGLLDQAAAQELAALALADRRPLLLSPEGVGDTEGVDALAPPAAANLLAALLTGGPAPRIQALLPDPRAEGLGGGRCAEVFVHRFPATTAWPSMPDGSASEDLIVGFPAPALLAADAAAWRFCRAASDADWIWERWRHGGFHRLLAEARSRGLAAELWLLGP